MIPKKKEYEHRKGTKNVVEGGKDGGVPVCLSLQRSKGAIKLKARNEGTKARRANEKAKETAKLWSNMDE